MELITTGISIKITLPAITHTNGAILNVSSAPVPLTDSVTHSIVGGIQHLFSRKNEIFFFIEKINILNIYSLLKGYVSNT